MGKVTFDVRHRTTADATLDTSLVAVLPPGGKLWAVTVNKSNGNSAPIYVRLGYEMVSSQGGLLASITLRNGWVRASSLASDGALTWTGELPIKREQRSQISARVRNDTGSAQNWDMFWLVEHP